MSVLRASILCSKVKKGGPERVKRGPEGLSLFKITPEKACSFFAPRGARCQLERAAKSSSGPHLSALVSVTAMIRTGLGEQSV